MTIDTNLNVVEHRWYKTEPGILAIFPGKALYVYNVKVTAKSDNLRMLIISASGTKVLACISHVRNDEPCTC